MNIDKFYTEDVEIYEKAKALSTELSELTEKQHFISGNYDSKIHAKIECSSNYNFNEKVYKKIELPVNVILDVNITKSFVLDQIDKRIKEINKQLQLLDDKFTKRLNENMKK